MTVGKRATPAPDGTTDSLFPIPRRIDLRHAIALARMEKKMLVLSPDELEELLDVYEHGRFRS